MQGAKLIIFDVKGRDIICLAIDIEIISNKPYN